MADVFVGGYQGFSGLAMSSASSLLRATGRVGLYEHGSGVQVAYNAGTWPTILSVFSQTGPGYAELPYVTSDVSNWFSTTYHTLFTGSGAVVSDAAVNVPSYVIDPATWGAFVSAAKAAGVSRVAPVFSPNYSDSPLGDFATLPAYASLRAAAIVGGGISLDTPPSYVLNSGNSYLNTIESEITWARAAGVRSTVIVSPFADGGKNFLENTAAYVALLASANALPDQWVVETYATDNVEVVGDESDPESVAGVAMFLASSNDTPATIASGALSLSWTTPGHLEIGGTKRIVVNDTGGQAYVVGGSGGMVLSSTGAGNHIWTSSGSTNVITSGAGAVVDSRGIDSLFVGTGSSVRIGGKATVLGGTGPSTYDVIGAAAMQSRSGGAGDVINAFAGSTLTLTVTGTYFQVVDGGAASVHVHETGGSDDNSLDVSGYGGFIYGGAGQKLTVSTVANQATTVTLGLGNNIVLSQGVNDLVTGGSGSNDILVLGTAVVQSRSGASDTIRAAAGSSVNLVVAGNYFNLLDTNATVHAAVAGVGGNAMDVTGTGGIIYGGAALGLNMQTAVGGSTKVVLSVTGSTVVAQGAHDTVVGNSGASYIIVNGTAAVLSQSATSDTVQANAGANLNLSVAGSYFNLFDNGATVHVAIASANGNTMDVSGTGGTIYGGAALGLNVRTAKGGATRVALGNTGSTVIAEGANDTVVGDGGNSYIVVTGTASVLSQSADSDTIQANTGSTVNAAVTGHYFNLFETGATVHVSETGGGDNSAMDVAGGGAVVYGGAGKGLSVRTTAGVATRVTLNRGNDIVVSQGTGDVITGDSGNAMIVVTGTASVLSQSADSDTIQANTGSTVNAAVTGHYFNLFETGATVHVSETGGGDNSAMDVAGGGAVIYGGAGQGLSVRTTAGVATRVTLNRGNDIVVSQGTGDVISGDSGNATIVVTGTASVLSQSADSDTIQARAGSTVNATVTGHYFNLFEAGATVHVTETSGGDNNSMDVTGGSAVVYGGAGQGLSVRTDAGATTRVTLNSGNDTVVSQGAGDVIVGDSGSSYIVVTGTASVLSQSTGSDTIQANAGSTVNAAVTGSYFNLMETGATVHVSETGGGDNSAMDVVGGGAVIYGGAGKGLSVRTNAGVATKVTLNTGNDTVVSQGTGDVITGNSGNATIVVTGTASVLSQSADSDTIQANAGSTVNATVTGHYFNLFDNGANVRVSETGGGDNSALHASGGGAVIYGGAGKGLSIRTNAGAATTVTLDRGNDTVVSQGTGDVVTGNSGNGWIVVSGSASVLSQSAGSDTIQANAGSVVNATVTGAYFTLTETSATAHVSETGGGDNSSMTVQGGSAIIYGGAGQGLNVRTTAGASTAVTLGTGNDTVLSLGNDTVHGGSGTMTFVGGTGASTVTGGAGAMIVTAGSGNISLLGSNAGDSFYAGTGNAKFSQGSGNNLTVVGQGNSNVIGGSGSNVYYLEPGTGSGRLQEIQNYHTDRDQVAYRGFVGNPVASQSINNGSLTLTLTDGDTVRFDGVTRLS